MSWADLRTAFPALSPSQLHRLLTQYQLASAMGPMSAWEPGADSVDAVQSGESFQAWVVEVSVGVLASAGLCCPLPGTWLCAQCREDSMPGQVLCVS